MRKVQGNITKYIRSKLGQGRTGERERERETFKKRKSAKWRKRKNGHFHATSYPRNFNMLN